MSKRSTFSGALFLVELFVGLAGGEPVDIGSRWELFVDDYLIEQMEGQVTL